MMDYSRIYLNKLKYPYLVGIPVSNLCNENCNYCIRKKYNFNDNDYFISLDNLEKLIRNVSKKIEYLNISAGYGEALLHPEIEYIFKSIKNNGIKLLCYTNGILMKDKVDLLAKADKVILSANKNIFNDCYKDYIRELRSNIIVSVIFDLSDNDFEHIFELCKFCDSHQINIELHWLFNNTGETVKTIDDANEELRAIKNMHSPYIHMPSNIKYKYIHCRDPWRSLYFDINGFLRPCCIFYESENKYNIFNNTIEYIWESDYMEKYRNMFISKLSWAYCKYCPNGFGNIREYNY